MDCLFCKIAAHEVDSNILYEDDQVVAFRDLKPLAPVHLLIVPKKHIEIVADLTEHDEPLMGHMVTVANQLARDKGVSEKGYRLIVNCGPQAGQAVSHLHLHLLAGRQLSGLG
jgi:histidine triad (HIT) family protein